MNTLKPPEGYACGRLRAWATSHYSAGTSTTPTAATTITTTTVKKQKQNYHNHQYPPRLARNPTFCENPPNAKFNVDKLIDTPRTG